MANAAVQERSDPVVRGRVTALFSVAFLGSTPIGSPIVGAISQQLGPRFGLAVGAVAALVTGIVGLAVLARRPDQGADSVATRASSATRVGSEGMAPQRVVASEPATTA